MIQHYVPAGEFPMGSDWEEIKNYPLAHEFQNEVPKHWVYLDAFWIDHTEVTNAQYAKCVADGGCTPSGCMDNPAFNQPNQPVVCVTREQAITYCHWAGRELPTEAQWEKAARGTDGRLYPWGDVPPPSCDYVVMNDGGLSCGRGETTLPVGSKPLGASPYGALDMAGNVWEWVSDWYDPNYYSYSPYENPTGPGGPVDDHLGVRRGGSFNRDQPSQLRAAIRYWQDVNTSNKTSLGFRCVEPSP